MREYSDASAGDIDVVSCASRGEHALLSQWLQHARGFITRVDTFACVIRCAALEVDYTLEYGLIDACEVVEHGDAICALQRA